MPKPATNRPRNRSTNSEGEPGARGGNAADGGFPRCPPPGSPDDREPGTAIVDLPASRHHEGVSPPAPPPHPGRPETAAPGDSAAPCRPTTGLAAEIGKRCPFECAEEEAYLNLIRTADVLARQFDGLFKARGLSQPLYNCLRILVGAETVAARCPDERGAGARGDGAPFHGLAIREIGDRLVAHAPDVTRLADRLEKLGLAERRRCSADRRSVRVFPTEKGRAVLAELADPVVALHRKQLGHLGADTLGQMSELLEAARRESEDRGAGPPGDGEPRTK